MLPSFFDPVVQEHLRITYKRQPFRFRQIETAVFHQRIINFSEMVTLPVEMREILARECTIIPFHLVKMVEDPEVVKFLFAGDDNQIFEAVLMYHFSTKVEDKINRMTLCISSQV
jgi:adenine C2-methylase RlmN of 23S rRNA A2503 and tRNA A37